MPKSLDPSSRFTMVLACDVDKPKELQPRLFARCLTLNQQRKLLHAIDNLRGASAPVEQLDAALDAAEICLSGWENMRDANGNDIPFTRDAIGDVLSVEEIVEIFEFVVSASVPSESDKKKSA